jgi:hypothetical protein
VNFSSPKNPIPNFEAPSPTQARKNQARPHLYFKGYFTVSSSFKMEAIKNAITPAGIIYETF